METRIFALLLNMTQKTLITLLALFLAPVSFAQTPEAGENSKEQVIQPQLERREIDLASVDAGDISAGLFAGLLSIEDFGTSGVYGARVAYHVSEGLFAELAYGSAEAGLTSLEELSGSLRLLTDSQRKLTYYNLLLGYDILPGESFFGEHYAFNSALFVVAGVGSTEFGGDEHFTSTFGFGYRLLFSDWFAARLDLRDHIFEHELLGERKTVNNLETTLSLSVFF